MITFVQYMTEMAITGLSHDIKTIGIVTPTNPKAKKSSVPLNHLFISQFLDFVRSLGYDLDPVTGRYEGSLERAFLIKNISRQKLIDIGKMYDQQSVIWGRRTNNASEFRYEYIRNGETTMTSNKLNIDSDSQSNYIKFKDRKFSIPFEPIEK